MKLKDLLKGRDKLREYDELTEWKRYFEHGMTTLSHVVNPRIIDDDMPAWNITHSKIPVNIKQIIINALDAEIKKMEEE